MRAGNCLAGQTLDNRRSQHCHGINLTTARDDPSPISNPWLKSTTLVKPSHRRRANRRLPELLTH